MLPAGQPGKLELLKEDDLGDYDAPSSKSPVSVVPACPPACLLQMNYNNKHLVGAIIVAGYDSSKGGQVYGCPIGGTMAKEKWAIDGSGSTYIWAYCDSEFK